MEKNNNKKTIIISAIVVALVLAIGILSYFVFMPKQEEKTVYGIKELYERLKNLESYSFNTFFDEENKMIFAKTNNKAYIEEIVDGVGSKTIVKDGNTYLVKDEYKEYYKYENNDTDIYKIESTLEELLDLDFETGTEKIENKDYDYVEYNVLTDFNIINTQNEKVATTKKTRFYFDGNNLAYIKTVLGNKEKTLKVEISENIDNNIFTIPSDYEEQ